MLATVTFKDSAYFDQSCVSAVATLVHETRYGEGAYQTRLFEGKIHIGYSEGDREKVIPTPIRQVFASVVERTGNVFACFDRDAEVKKLDSEYFTPLDFKQQIETTNRQFEDIFKNPNFYLDSSPQSLVSMPKDMYEHLISLKIIKERNPMFDYMRDELEGYDTSIMNDFRLAKHRNHEKYYDLVQDSEWFNKHKGQYIAIFEETVYCTEPDKKELFKQLAEGGNESFFVTQVGVRGGGIIKPEDFKSFDVYKDAPPPPLLTCLEKNILSVEDMAL